MDVDIIREPHFFLNATIYDACNVQEFLQHVKLKAVNTNLKKRKLISKNINADLMFKSFASLKAVLPEEEAKKSNSKDETIQNNLVHFSS